MSIQISPDGKQFRLDTKSTTYACGVGVNGYLNHYYYGPGIPDSPETFRYLDRHFSDVSFSPYREGNDLHDARNIALQECTTHALGDYRSFSVSVTDSLGCDSTDPFFHSARVYAGAPEIADMPHARLNGDKSVETLEITLKDPATGVLFLLNYTVFPEQDCIVRSMRVVNASDKTVTLNKAMSFCLDFTHSSLDLIQSNGSYGRERFGYSRSPLHPGMQGFFSSRTSSGHDHNPAFALAERSATEFSGEVYGAVLVYSGSFSVEVEYDSFFRTRAMAGICADTFSWELLPDASFQTPQAILTFSNAGIGGMSRNFHDFMREHLISPRWAHADRPILVNNWEGTGMSFTKQKLLDIADVAAQCNLEMFVLDDGWFGHRDNDRSSLGDWFVNEPKVGSMRDLAAEINRKGLKFGLWFEPEMISIDSELYKKHPEWLFTAPNRERTYGRHQCVLNFAIPEAVDYVFKMIYDILSTVPVYYMKWDMNRQPAEIYLDTLPPHRQKEVGHRYVLGVYELHRRILAAFPELLIEGCSGGGGRFDAGILYYAPQIWTSDNTDVLDRMYIQSSTSLFYPCSAQGAHVTTCAAGSLKRFSPIDTRAAVAFAGTFGYELDMTTLPEEDREAVRRQCETYHKWHHLVSDGDFYRLCNPWDRDGRYTAWEFAAKDGSEFIFTFVMFRQIIHPGINYIRMQGLLPGATYRLDGTDETYTGSFLMNAGLPMPAGWRDFYAYLWHFTKISD